MWAVWMGYSEVWGMKSLPWLGHVLFSASLGTLFKFPTPIFLIHKMIQRVAGGWNKAESVFVIMHMFIY